MRSEPLYHTGDQYADSLLAPMARTLSDLAVRAGHYATRLRMPDGDREIVEMAQRILEIARQDIADLLVNVADQPGAVE